MLPLAEPLASGSSCLQALPARYSGMCCIVSAFCVTSLRILLLRALLCVRILAMADVSVVVPSVMHRLHIVA
jgi:hypothetical protein